MGVGGVVPVSPKGGRGDPSPSEEEEGLVGFAGGSCPLRPPRGIPVSIARRVGTWTPEPAAALQRFAASWKVGRCGLGPDFSRPRVRSPMQTPLGPPLCPPPPLKHSDLLPLLKKIGSLQRVDYNITPAKLEVCRVLTHAPTLTHSPQPRKDLIDTGRTRTSSFRVCFF